MAGPDPLALKGVLLEGHVTIERALAETPHLVAYRAVVRGLSEPVALKAFRVAQSADDARVAAFVEALAACAGKIDELSHAEKTAPSLVSYGLAKVPGGRVPYLATKWIDGATLASELDLRTAAVPLPEIAGWLRDVVPVLEASHRLGLVHGDLSPATLFLEKVAGGQPRLRVTDFGVAGLLETFGAELSGAPAFEARNAPPEQLEPAARRVGPSADVHALALSLLEAMLPRLKRKTGPLAQRKKRSLEAADRPTPKKLGLAVSPAFGQAIERAIAARPEDRFASVTEMFDAFRAAEPTFATKSMPAPVAKPSVADVTVPAIPARMPSKPSLGAVGEPTAPALAAREPSTPGVAARPPSKPAPAAREPSKPGFTATKEPSSSKVDAEPFRIGGASEPPPPLRNVSDRPRGFASGLAIPAIPPAPKAPAVEPGPAPFESTAVDRLPPEASATEEIAAAAEATAVDRVAPSSAPPPASARAGAIPFPLPAHLAAAPSSPDATRIAIPVDARLVALPEDEESAPSDRDVAPPVPPAAPPPQGADSTRIAIPVDARLDPAFDPSSTAPVVVEQSAAPRVDPVAALLGIRQTVPMNTPAPHIPEAVMAAIAPSAGLPAAAPYGPPLATPYEPQGAAAYGPPAAGAEYGPAPHAAGAEYGPAPHAAGAEYGPAPHAAGAGAGYGPAPHAAVAGGTPVHAASPNPSGGAARPPSMTDDDPPAPPLESSRPLVIGAAVAVLVLVLVGVGFFFGTRKPKASVGAEPPVVASSSPSAAPSSVAETTNPSASASATTSASAAPAAGAEPPPASSSAPPAEATFDAAKAQAALEAVPGTQSECRKLNGPRGKWKATVTFEPTGKPSAVELDKPFNRTPSGKCVESHLKTAEIPPFAGPAQKATMLVTIAVSGK